MSASPRSPTSSSSAVSLRLEVGSESSIGRNPQRRRNEDWRYYTRQPNDPIETESRQKLGDLFIVCDGMGGRDAGQEASDIAGQAIRRQYYYMQPDGLPVEEMLHNSLHEANRAVFDLSSQKGSKWFGMGTTAVVAVVKDGNLYIANVGDSRAYLLPAGGSIQQVTEDHTWVQEALKAKRISPEEAKTHPNRGALTRSLGNNPNVQPYVQLVGRLSAGDTVVLCSDGLTDVVSDGEIQKVIEDNRPQAAAEKLVQLANEHGGPDNITVIVFQAYDPAHPPTGAVVAKNQLRKVAMILAATLVFLTMALAVILLTQRGIPEWLKPGGISTPTPTSVTNVAPLLGTATATRSLSPSSTPAPTSTPIPTSTPTNTPTPTPTHTPTHTPTPAPTPTLPPSPMPAVTPQPCLKTIEKCKGSGPPIQVSCDDPRTCY